MARQCKTKRELVSLMKVQLGREDAALRALMAIYNNQTSEEQKTESLTVRNGVGFTGMDTKFLTSLAKQYLANGKLSVTQMKYLLKKIQKYAGQLVESSIGRGMIRKENGLWVW